MNTAEHEFKVGDKVTYQAYKQNEPTQVEVLFVKDTNFWGKVDGNIYYHLGYINPKGFKIVTNQTTSKYIKESTQFNPNENYL